MSSPVRVLGSVAPASRARHAKRRILSDSSDAEERDPKRVKSQEATGDQGRGRDTKEKKRRHKKKRKVSVVESAPDSDPESPTVATKLTLSRARSRSVTISDADGAAVAFSGKMTRDDTRQPSAGPSSMPELEAKLGSPLRDRDQTSPSHSAPFTTAEVATSVDKGKGRATPEAAAPPNDSQQLSDFQKQVADKTSLVSKHENLVSSLQQSLSCQICLDLMHRPYALAPCGHSACHQCLVNWFKAPPPDIPPDDVFPTLHRKKTCPHCRAVVRDRPIEIWTIKEMVATLVKSGLATGFYNSAPDQPEGGANADPWVGIFRAAGQHIFPGDPYPGDMHQLMGLRDDEDAVYRCIDCNHEIWDGVCSHCGRDYPGHDGPDFDVDVVDDDSDDDSSDDAVFPFAHAARAGLRSLFRHLLQPVVHPGNHVPVVEDEPADRDWDGGGDTEIESVDDDSSPRGPAHERVARRAHGFIVSSDDEDDDGVPPEERARRLVADRAAARERGFIMSESSDEAGYESSFIDDGEAPPATNAAVEVDDGLDHDQVDGPREDDGEDDDSVHIRPTRLRAPMALARRRNAFIVSDDEDFHDADGSDRSRSHDEDAEGEDLADEVAAREFEMYGDDGSIPRGDDHGYNSYGSEDDLY